MNNTPPALQKLIDQAHRLSALHSEHLELLYQAVATWGATPSPTTLQAFLDIYGRLNNIARDYTQARKTAQTAIMEHVGFHDGIEQLDLKRLPRDFYSVVGTARLGPAWDDMPQAEERSKLLQRLYAQGKVTLSVLQREGIEPLPCLGNLGPELPLKNTYTR